MLSVISLSLLSHFDGRLFIFTMKMRSQPWRSRLGEVFLERLPIPPHPHDRSSLCREVTGIILPVLPLLQTERASLVRLLEDEVDILYVSSSYCCGLL